MNKISKGKAVGLLSLGLASVALGSVGFASWVISTTQADGTANISVSVGEISDQRITIKAKVNEGDKAVVFDAVDSQNSGTIKGSGSRAEDLTFKVDVTGKKGAEFSGDVYNCKFAFALPEGIDTTYVKVGSVKVDGTAVDNWDTGFGVPVTTDTLGKTTTYTFTLEWGEKFKNTNPALMTDEQINAAGGLDTVIANLRTLNEKLDTQSITVTLSSATA